MMTMTKTALGLTAVMVTGLLITGPAAPKPAEANDTGRIIAGLAAGAIVYGLLGDNHRSGARHARTSRGAGYYNGNSRTWDSRPTQRRTQPRRQTYQAPRRENPRQTYNRGYDRGWNNGYSTGYNRGWNNGADYGYSRGYDHGYSDGGGWINWGYSGGGCY